MWKNFDFGSNSNPSGTPEVRFDLSPLPWASFSLRLVRFICAHHEQTNVEFQINRYHNYGDVIRDILKPGCFKIPRTILQFRLVCHSSVERERENFFNIFKVLLSEILLRSAWKDLI